MEYPASQELVDILLKYGFNEETKRIYTNHWELMQERKEYDPGSIKRFFVKGRLEITFDYIRLICTYPRYTSVFFNKYRLSENELISILYFTSIKPNQKSSYRNKRISPSKIIDSLNDDYTHLDSMNSTEKKSYYKRKAEFETFWLEFYNRIKSVNQNNLNDELGRFVHKFLEKKKNISKTTASHISYISEVLNRILIKYGRKSLSIEEIRKTLLTRIIHKKL